MKNNCKDCGKHRDELQESPWTTLVGNEWLIICKPCKKKEIDKAIADFEYMEIETDFTDEIICPYCGTKHEPNGESAVFYSDGDYDFKCEYCSNEFKVNTHVSISYSSTKV